MSDILCVVCAEPWDAWGVRHGDMAPWESALFRAGAGCPACEGAVPKDGHPELTMAMCDNGDEDPMLRINAHEAVGDGRKPAWVRPEDPVHWTCSGCGVQAITDLDSGDLEYYMPSGAVFRLWYHSHPFHRSAPEKTPAHTFNADCNNPDPVCEFCLNHCNHCGIKVSGIVDAHDMYADEAWCTTLEGHNHNDLFCVECVEKQCSECLLIEDCSCVVDAASSIENRMWGYVRDGAPESWPEDLRTLLNIETENEAMDATESILIDGLKTLKRRD